jgi:endonuclease/exonuclease/phosphatase family metal-dependent hydrolase
MKRTLSILFLMLVLLLWGCSTDDPTEPFSETSTIVINPEPNSINAPWDLSGPNNFSLSGNGDQTIANMDVGEYTLVWGVVSGWMIPNQVQSTQTLLNNGTISFSGSYVGPTGTIAINPDPDSISPTWILDGPNNYSIQGAGDIVLNDMVVGSYMLTWGQVDGWNSPSPSSVSKVLVEDDTVEFNGAYSSIDIFHGLSFGGDYTFDVITWNLQTYPRNNMTTIEYVADAIRNLDADVIAIQEIMNWVAFDLLVDQLDGYDGYHATSDDYMDLGYIWRTDMVSEITFEEPLSGNTPFPRYPLVMHMTFGGEQFVLVNNHLKCCGDGTLEDNDPQDEEYRRALACNMLDEWIREESQGTKLILLGDLNDKLDDTPSNNVFQVFLDDAARYQFVDLPLADSTQRASWSWRLQAHIDHILITDELFEAFSGSLSEVQTIRLDTFLAGGFGEYNTNISDHFPVGVKLDISE